MPKNRRNRWEVAPETLAPRVRFLAGLDVFAGASDADLRRLALSADEEVCAAGTDVIREGRIPTHFYAVRAGSLEVWSRGESEESSKINTLGVGDHFGEIGLIEGMPSTATVRAATSSELVRIPAADFLGVLSDSPQLLQPLLQRVAGALARSHPSYQLATDEAGVRSPDALLGDIRDALGTLSDEQRARFVAELRSLVEEDGPGD